MIVPVCNTVSQLLDLSNWLLLLTMAVPLLYRRRIRGSTKISYDITDKNITYEYIKSLLF
jgi:hypothetical protein